MKYFFVVIVCWWSFQMVAAQKITDGETFFNNGEYEQALTVYQTLLKKKPADGLLNFKAARCLYELQRPLEAEPYFVKAAEKKLEKAYRFLGEIYFYDYKFAKAVEAYDAYLEFSPSDSSDVEILRDKAQIGAKMIERVEDIAVLDSAVMPKNEILSYFRRHLNKNLGQIGTFSEIFQTTKGKEWYGFVSGRKDRIIYAEQNGKNTDLYISYRLLDGWNKSVPLSANINTDKNENYPFVLADGITIYFASEGHESLGGYDIFMSRFNTSTNDYLPPQNVGMPFNSPFNDYCLIIDEMSNVGWFVTDRYQKEDSVIIYQFVPNSERLILRDKDEDYVRDASRMWRYRKASSTADYKVEDDSDTSQRPLEVVSFVVNDTVVYSDTLDFKSREACENYIQALNLRALLVQKEFTLDAKRDVWEIEENVLKRDALANEILSLEHMLLNLKKQMADYERQARLLENAALKP